MNEYAIFGVVAIWFVLGWLTAYLVRIRALEFLTIIITGSIVSILFYYFSGIELWFITLITGVSILFWTISLVTKLILFPQKETS
jgi:hypothetical protein